MIQSILFFSLGFLCAVFLAFMVAPALWRRAVELTRRRIEASVPLSALELQAEKDRLRAEHAMLTRRLEMKLRSATEKSTAQSLEIVRIREEAKRLSQDFENQAHANEQLDRGTPPPGVATVDHAGTVEEMTEKLADMERAAEERGSELGKLEKLYEEASFASSSRQIELVARESEIEKLSGELERQAREVDRLRAEIQQASAGGSPSPGREQRSDDKALRDQISTLAAEVVHLTALLEGPESQIYKALGPNEPVKGRGKAAAFPSLADRVRSLQKAAEGR